MTGDVDSKNSTSGYLITFLGEVVSWQSRLHKCVALLTTEVEYIVITVANKELLWMKKFLQELGLQQERYLLYCDSQSAIHLSKNPTFHSRSKHIDVIYHLDSWCTRYEIVLSWENPYWWEWIKYDDKTNIYRKATIL